MDNVSRKQQQIAKAKAKGIKNKDIGRIHYPNAKPAAQAVLVSRELKKTNVAKYLEQSKLQALKDLNVTWHRIVRPISEALDAEKSNGEVDHQTRLSAAKQARELLQVKEYEDTTRTPSLKVPEGINEIELQRIMFKKGDNTG